MVRLKTYKLLYGRNIMRVLQSIRNSEGCDAATISACKVGTPARGMRPVSWATLLLELAEDPLVDCTISCRRA